ncbi:MAG: tRNA (N(6)-L-threonylcarbamoyladenosine(37)-C(2))-methylthiotransferase MtaB [Candidatus Syntrophonatronum acetioxidans]|uniref:Threonylcarbamoyladenosine tRNA methylthiotransferase MtaB n=1 Tax=Candidatus Syntrophonatronum acetioxidans TaxID=1795816 RepID=A0A424YCS9_9FIRM|nr:MAG: tRNA (N(6)-L-threonylcarbamoyladenosine(37)-C(2))-methylthiotransferase MtaB [Candidatus Syntrophonatronum acetioxidans]
MNKTRAAFFTLGCKVNQYETEALKNIFRQKGYEIVDFSKEADVYVINTCTVTHLSDRKSRQAIRRARKNNPRGLVAVVGCYAQLAWKKIKEIPGVDLIIGTQGKKEVLELIEKAKERKDFYPLIEVKKLDEKVTFEEMPLEEVGRTRAFIKIEDGCEHFCSYCLVPYARGPVRSRKLEDLVKEVERLTTAGTKEIVLTGVNLGAYGKDSGEDLSLAVVIKRLERVPSLKRLRLSSLEPTDFTMELLEVLADSAKVCHHLHIPLQSGDDYTLKRMNRLYTADEYRKLVSYLRYLMPCLALTTDVMVGFPGEEEENFNNTCRFIEEMAFSRLHVFKYSPRTGTEAWSYANNLSPREKDRRSKKLTDLGKKMAAEYSKTFLGKEAEVLFEQERKLQEKGKKVLEGLSRHYQRVRAQAGRELIGEIGRVKIEEYDDGCLWGKLI